MKTIKPKDNPEKRGEKMSSNKSRQSKVQRKKTVMIAGGGTGGHIYPGVALATELKERGYNVVWMGSGSKLEKSILNQYPLKYEHVTAKPFRGASLIRKIVLPIDVAYGVVSALIKMLNNKPKFLITMGGYVSVTSAIAAAILKIPIHMCEQNSRCGLANKVLSVMATTIFTAYPNVFRKKSTKKIIETGNPLRKELIKRSNKKRRLKKEGQKLTVLVMGGSQGAKTLNENVPRIMKEIKSSQKIRVIHQTGGTAQIEKIIKAYKESGIEARVEKYFDDIAGIYSEVDLVIARSGALTLSELMQFELPAILVPLPGSADNHQFFNALHHERKGACWILQQEDLFREGKLEKMIDILMTGEGTLKKMKHACIKMKRENVAEKIIQACENNHE